MNMISPLHPATAAFSALFPLNTSVFLLSVLILPFLGQNMSWFYLLLVNICHGFAFSYDFTFYLLLVKIPEDPAVACHTYLVCRESYTIGVSQVLK